MSQFTCGLSFSDLTLFKSFSKCSFHKLDIASGLVAPFTVVANGMDLL